MDNTSTKEIEVVENHTEPATKENKSIRNPIYVGKQNLSILSSNKIKVPFLKKGNWTHDTYGEVSFQDEDINQLVDNYKNNVLGFKPYLTLGHLDEELDSTDSHRKRGDLEDIVVEEDTVFGVFSVPDNIYKAIENKEYEYSSGEFNRAYTDKESGSNLGTTVLRVALTNSPFIPFNETKIQTLSEEAESCPETRENYMFLLSIDSPNSKKLKQPLEGDSEDLQTVTELKTQTDNLDNKDNNKNINNNIMTTKLNELDSSIEEKKAQDNLTEVNNSEKLESVVTPVLETSKEELVEMETPVMKSEATVTKQEVTENSNKDLVLANLTSQLNNIQKLYNKQLETANDTIKSLTNKIENLTERLMGQEKVTQQFSTSMNKAQENLMIEAMQSKGVLPVTVNKFLEFKNAYEHSTDKKTLKLSVNVGEEKQVLEKSVIDSVAELLISASNNSPVIEQQLGISAGRKSGNLDFTSIIDRNKTVAKKLEVH